MDEELTARRQRGQALAEAGKEDLELYGVEELEERVAVLEAEIERTRAEIGKRGSKRAAAEALFNFNRN